MDQHVQGGAAPGAGPGAGPSRSSRTLPLAGFALLTAGMVVAGVFLDGSLRAGARRRAGAELGAVASLKVASIVAWRDEHLRNAAFAASYPVMLQVVQASGRGPVDPTLAEHATTVLGHFAERQRYLQMALRSSDHRGLVEWRAAGAPEHPFDDGLVQAALDALAGPVAAIHDHLERDRPWLDVAMAVSAPGAPSAVLLLRVDLGPLLDEVFERWPVPSETAAAALVRRADGSARVLSASRALREGLRSLSLPLANRQLPSVQAALGAEGLLDGIDFKGVAVLAAVRPVPGTEWKLLVKMSLAEVEAPLVRPALTIFGLMGLLLLSCGVMMALWWRQEGVRARSAEALGASEDRLRLALAGTHFVWEWDLERRRLALEQDWTRWSGHPDRVLEGDPQAILAALIHPDDVPAVLARHAAHVRGETPIFESEHRTVVGGGAVRWVLVRGRASLRGADGRARRMSGVVSDVTERRELQAQLERSERMASLGTLAAGLAHEINNPLAAVLANLESLQRELGAGAGPGVAELLAETRDGAERVRDVVRSLRTFARPGAEGPRATDVRGEIDAAVRLTLNELRHHARLDVRVGDLPPVAASAHQLGQVFLNLLTNAAQAIPEGNATQHRITLEATTAPDGWARVEVRDSGAGIAPELLPRIFEPFFTTKAQGVGTGLGLAIVHSIVAAVGGRVEVESRLGSGTTFRVLLPPAPAATPPPETAAAPVAPPGPKRRVLLVDDDALVARSLVRMLRHTHQVTVAASGAEALGRLDSGERYDAILCDLMMPQMSGPELHAQLARRDPALAARVVFVTGGAFTEGSTEFLRTASNACLEKPVDQGELVEALDRAAAA